MRCSFTIRQSMRLPREHLPAPMLSPSSLLLVSLSSASKRCWVETMSPSTTSRVESTSFRQIARYTVNPSIHEVNPIDPSSLHFSRQNSAPTLSSVNTLLREFSQTDTQFSLSPLDDMGVPNSWKRVWRPLGGKSGTH